MIRQVIHIRELDTLRGMLTAWVVFGHWFATLPISLNTSTSALYNDKAVRIFFMLSGFVICFLHWQKPEPYPVFLLRRALRLFPAYLVVLAASICLLPFAADLTSSPVGSATAQRIDLIQKGAASLWAGAIPHIFLAQGLVPTSIAKEASFLFVGQAWSISAEWQFYLVAPVVIGWAFSISKTSSMTSLALFCAIVFILQRFFGSGFAGQHLLLFALGFVSFHIWREIELGHWPLSLGQLRGAFIAAGLVLGLMHDKVLIAIWLLVLYTVLAARRDNAPVERWCSALLTSRPLHYIGAISYSVYLTHMVALYLSMGLLAFVGLSGPSYAIVSLVLMLFLTGLLSLALHYAFERPGIELGRSLGARIEARSSRNYSPRLSAASNRAR